MFKHIKKWLNCTGGKYVIVENNKPKYIVMKIEDFEALIKKNPDDKINQEIIALEEQEKQGVDISLDIN